MLEDFLIHTCYMLTRHTISEDGIFKDTYLTSPGMNCRITNAGVKDLALIQHVQGVVREYKKIFLSAIHINDISYDMTVESNGIKYEINNIYAPSDAEEIHHIKLLVSRTLGSSS